MSYFYPIARKNKFTWTYRFLYWNPDIPKINLYTIDTDQGFQVAESAAWGSATFDNCTKIKYIGKNKMEVDNGTNA